MQITDTNNRCRSLRVAAMCWQEQDGTRQKDGLEIITKLISAEGIRFQSDRILPVGTVLLTDLYLPGQKDPISCKLNVAHVEPELKEDRYIIDAWFRNVKEEDQAAIAASLEKLDVYQLLETAIKTGATDVHLTVGRPPLMRQHGKIRPMTTDPVGEDEIKAMLYPLLTSQQIETFEQQLELDFAFSPTLTSRFRVNMHWQRQFVEAAFRNIPTKIKSFSELGLPVEPLQSVCRQKAGLFLIAGATGSGKTTTLSSMVHHMNTTQEGIIITVEDPIEYFHTSQKGIVKQRELGSDTHTYGNALRHVLRQDPDVICVGELLDAECLASALRAAETGHLVLSTIHAPDTAHAIQRAVNFFPPEHAPNICQQLSTSLVGVLFQSLLPSMSRGRVPATELLLNNSAVANMIRDARFSQMASVLQTGRAQGMYTLKSSLNDLHEKGLIESSIFEGFKKLEYTQ